MFERSLVRRFVSFWRQFACFCVGLAYCCAVTTAVGQTFVELGRTPYQGNDYLLIGLAPAVPGGVATPMDPFQARLGATHFGGWLMTVADREEEVTVLEALRDFRTEGSWGSADVWIGLSDSVQEGTFIWENGDPVNYTNWAPGEPNNVGGGAGPGEDHAEIWVLDDPLDPEYLTWNDEGSASSDNFAVVEMPGTPPPLVLQIDPTTGYGRFRANFDSEDILSVTLNSYELLPDGTPFDVAAWNASNLTARGVDAIDPDAEGERWETLNASPSQLLEAYLLGGSEFSEGETLVLGKIFPNGSGDAPLTLNYTVNIDNADPERPDSRNTLYEDPVVEYVEFDVSSPGDYNGDGLVNLADYTVWRDTRNSTTNLAADGNNSGSVEAGDYTFWRQRFGTAGSGAGEGSDAAVPEPGLVCFCMSAMVAVVALRRGLVVP